MILSENLLFCISFLYSQSHLITKRASSCISKKISCRTGRKRIKGSVTIETAMILPFFLLAMICIIYMMEVMVIRTSIRSGMQYAAKNIAEKVYVLPVVSVNELEEQIIQAIGAERLDRSVVVNGSGGIHCEQSRISVMTGILDVKVQYQVKVPVPAISNISVPMQESIKVKGWCGYSGGGFYNDLEETVYLTENGMVYHKKYDCSYLELSIRGVSAEEVDTIRNKDQGIYHACEVCAKKGKNELVYVTDYGNRYHNSLNCSGLKRTIYAVPISEAAGKGVCSKCGR